MVLFMDCVTILYGKLNWLIVFELVFCGLGGDNTSWNMIVILLLVWMVCLNYNCIDMVYQKKKTIALICIFIPMEKTEFKLLVASNCAMYFSEHR